MKYVARVNLKTDTPYRDELIDFCLKSKKQYLAIGWSRIYNENDEITFSDYYQLIKKESKRINPVLNIFKDVSVDDLFWTRDLDGNYWVCRAADSVIVKCDKRLDFGALLPVEAYKVGTQVPGQIKATFNRPRGGTGQRIYDDIIVEYSKAVYNHLSGSTFYKVFELQGSILDNLPDFDLEELVIAYIQIKYDYYVLSNSIASKSTTIKIECEFLSRNPKDNKKAVVQVKGKKATPLDAIQYLEFIEQGYEVFLYAPSVCNSEKLENVVVIRQEDLLEFYGSYKKVLPKSITQWENLF